MPGSQGLIGSAGLFKIKLSLSLGLSLYHHGGGKVGQAANAVAIRHVAGCQPASDSEGQWHGVYEFESQPEARTRTHCTPPPEGGFRVSLQLRNTSSSSSNSLSDTQRLRLPLPVEILAFVCGSLLVAPTATQAGSGAMT